MLVIETASPGGQAGSSSKIENYLGFPTGLSGQELAARAIAQTEKFGAKMMVAHSVCGWIAPSRPFKIVLDNGNKIAARAVVIATGAQYNKPPSLNLKRFEGQGIYYGATLHGIATVRRRGSHRRGRRELRRASRGFSFADGAQGAHAGALAANFRTPCRAI